MVFKVGDIITGTSKHNGYSITTSRAVMLVTKSSRNEMTVMILGDVRDAYLNNEYSVDNSTECFKRTTIEEFLEQNPDSYMLDVYKVEELFKQYPKSEEVETTEEKAKDVLSDKERKELHSEIVPLLKQYHYHPTESGVDAFLDEWATNKAPLLDLFKKHPNYNGKYQIVFDHDYDRVFDIEAINYFVHWLHSEEVHDMFKKEVQIGELSYSEVNREYRKYDDLVYYWRNYGNGHIETINGKTFDELKALESEFYNLREEYLVNCSIYDEKAYDATLFKTISKIRNLTDIIRNTRYLGQFVNHDACYYFDRYFPEAKIAEGQKLSRSVNKVLCLLGVNKAPNYNREFAKFADAVNPLKIKRHTVISIHPVDYFTMSFGNSWSSCHTIDKRNDRGIDSDHNWQGCNSSGVMSYMLDGTSVVFYTVSADYNGDKLELENKINRCMFHYYDNQLVQGRVYPQSNDRGANDLYKDIREIAQKVFADMLDVPNYWTNKSGVDACCDVIESYGTHYLDYENYDNCNVSTLKDDGKEMHSCIHVGHNPICPRCGKLHDRTDNIECYYC